MPNPDRSDPNRLSDVLTNLTSRDPQRLEVVRLFQYAEDIKRAVQMVALLKPEALGHKRFGWDYLDLNEAIQSLLKGNFYIYCDIDDSVRDLVRLPSPSVDGGRLVSISLRYNPEGHAKRLLGDEYEIYLATSKKELYITRNFNFSQFGQFYKDRYVYDDSETGMAKFDEQEYAHTSYDIEFVGYSLAYLGEVISQTVNTAD